MVWSVEQRKGNKQRWQVFEYAGGRQREGEVDASMPRKTHRGDRLVVKSQAHTAPKLLVLAGVLSDGEAGGIRLPDVLDVIVVLGRHHDSVGNLSTKGSERVHGVMARNNAGPNSIRGGVGMNAFVECMSVFRLGTAAAATSNGGGAGSGGDAGSALTRKAE